MHWISKMRLNNTVHAATPRRFRALSVLLVLATIVANLVPDVVFQFQPRAASAHNLQMDIQFVSIDPSFQQMFERRLTNNEPLIQSGDVVTLVFGGLPVLGTTDGMGGYFDFYPVTGTQVLAAEYVRPVPGGYAAAPVKSSPGAGTVIGTSDPTGQLKNFTLGPNINGVSSSPSTSGSVNKGTLYGFYGDTGIFYSTDPRTVYGSWGNASGNVVNNRGEVVNDVPVTRFDVDQLRALGMSSPAACIFDSACRGSGPWGMGSPVAGPESGYQWSFRITNTLQTGVPAFAVETGPFRRIRYPGSRISNDAPGNASSAIFDGSVDASGIGYALSANNPLPATTSWTDTTSTKLVRFAVGRILFNQPEYARITLKVNDASSLLTPGGCPLLNAMAFSGDAGIASGGKDILWRYFNPTQSAWNPCLAVFKQAQKAAYGLNEVFTYTLKAYNTGAYTLTNVTIQDDLPAGLTYVGAAPAPRATAPLKWSVATIAPGKAWSAILTVKGTTAGQQVNTLRLTSDQGQAGTQAIVAVASPIMNQTKTVTPESATPGSVVTYTIRLENSGTGASATPIKVYESLPAGISFVGLSRVTLNGANVTSSSTATAGRPVTISLPSSTAVAAGQTAEIVFTAQVSASATAGSYCNSFTTAYGAVSANTASVACVTVASASIGDTIYRDWNGNGVQDPGEEGIPGVVVTTTSGLSTTTGADGKYIFAGLPAGTYTVVVGVPANYSVTGDPVGGLDGQATYTLTSTQSVMTADFGLKPTGGSYIGNQVYDDADRSALPGVGEAGIANVTVRLYEDTNGNGVVDADDVNVMTTTTGAGGYYTFTNLASGFNYVAVVNAADPDLSTYFTSAPYAATTPISAVVANLSPSGYEDADFGFWKEQPASIGDQVCIDGNQDGLCTAGETGVMGVVVSIYRDSNGDGVGETLVTTATTSVTGYYRFDGLAAGTYAITVDLSDPALPDGYAFTTDVLTQTVTGGQTVTTIDFPAQPLITKQGSRTTANAGDVIVYTITHRYNGTDDIDADQIIDPIPTGTTFASAGQGGTYGIFTPSALELGVDDQTSFSTGMSVTVVPSVTTPGGVVTVTMRLTSTTAISNVTPSVAATNVAATCATPTPSTAVTVTSGAPQTIVFRCTVSSQGESVFLGSASGTESGADYDFASGASNSFLANNAGTAAIVTWNIGSTAPGTAGVGLGSGTLPQVYALQGDGKNELMSYWPLTTTWSKDPPADSSNVNQGGALVWNGVTGAGSGVYAFFGNGTTTFKVYSQTLNSWTNRANAPGAVKFGGALTRIGNVIYALRGNNTLNFYTYTISSDVWATAASVPAGSGGKTVNAGGALATDGTYVYALKGNNTTEFYRYTPATNTWTALASTPGATNKGAALVYLNGYFYALRGAATKSFYRYDPVADAWSDGAVADPSIKADGGAALTTDGTVIYMMGGGRTSGFQIYTPSTGKWAAATKVPQNVKDGGALAYAVGSAAVDKRSEIDLSRTLVGSGERITVTLELYSSSTLTTITPSALTISDTAGAGGVATCGSPTTLTRVVSGTTGSISWSCLVTATNRPANLTFSAVATASLPTTQAWGRATSHSILVVPPLTMSVQVKNPAGVTVIDNQAILDDDGALFDPTPSNEVKTYLGATIGDRVWADLDGDGVQDVGEPGIAGVVVMLTTPNGVVTTTTDANGAYAFSGLTAGTYTVTYRADTAPAGYLATTATSIAVPLSAGQVLLTADFGLQPPGTGSIGDTVWLDADGDGTYNADPSVNKYEMLLPGVGVRLYADVNGNGRIDAADILLATTATDANGAYLFSSLREGRYLVQVDSTSVVTSPYDAAYTTTLGAGLTVTFGGGYVQTATLTAGQQITTVDYGFNWTGAIGDYVWYDTSADGVQNNGADDGGAPGAVVELYYDVNGNGEPDADEPILSVVLATTSTGAYRFSGLPPGRYVVEAEGQAIPAPSSAGALAGSLQTMLPTTPDEVGVTLAAGQTYVEADFGFAAGSLVEGHVFFDPNSNSSIDGSETTGFTGLVVTLTSSSGAVLTTTTDANGFYLFPPVAPGTFTVTYDSAAPSLANYPAKTSAVTRKVDVVYGQVATVDFGRNYVGEIGDLVWLDDNYDRIAQAEEPGFANVTVYLYRDGQIIATTATGPTGTYKFSGLSAGTYSVTVRTADIPLTYYSQSTPSGGQPYSLTLGLNQVITTADFGYATEIPTHRVSGSIFDDKNGDGVLTETGRITGVMVTVTFTPSGELPITVNVPVNASGTYTVVGIPDGADVAIRVDPTTVPFGYERTTTETLTIAKIGEDKVNQDFGYQLLLGQLSGAVVVGLNGDGTAQFGAETPVSAVTVTLRYAGPDGFFGTDDDQLIVTTTLASGYYTFTNLMPGLYELVKQNPSSYAGLSDRDGGSPDSILAELARGENLLQQDFELTEATADLRVTKSVNPAVVAAGASLTYTILVTNAGPSDAAGVRITDVLPTGVEYVTSSLPTASTSPLVWTMDSLAAFATQQITLVAQAGSDVLGVLTNVVTVTSVTSDPTPENNVDDEPVTVLPSADLQITKTAHAAAVTAGKSVTYTLVVVNHGPSAAANTVVTDELPTGVTLATATPTAAGTSTLVWSLGTVAAGGVQTLTVVVNTNGATPSVITNTARVGSDTPDPTPENNVDDVPVSIGEFGVVVGHLFIDLDGDGVQDPEEPNLPGITLIVTDSLGVPHSVTSDASGHYTITLPSGPAVVDVDETTLPPSYYQTAGNDIDPITVVDGETTDAGDDGYRSDLLDGELSLGDHVWYDADKNGVQDGNEEGVSYVLVQLYTSDGVFVSQMRTDGDGYYLFTGLKAGSYKLRFEVNDTTYSFVDPKATDDTFDSDVTPVSAARALRTAAGLLGETSVVTLTTSTLAVDAGIKLPVGVQPAGLVVRVWYDANRDGLRGSVESMVSAVTVQIVRASDGVIVAQKVTDARGVVTVTTLSPGAYYARVLPVSGYDLTTPNVGGDDNVDSDVDPATNETPVVTLADGEINDTLAAGLVLPIGQTPGTVRGVVWFDADRNNQQDPGETPVSGATVYLLDAAGNVLATVKTGESGAYEFANLPPGDYRVRIVKPTGYTAAGQNVGPDASDSDIDPTTEESELLTVTSGQTVTVDAGVQLPPGELPASLSGVAWLDADRSGVREAGETLLAGLRVRLFASNGALLAQTVTDENGAWRFTNLVAGTYYVDVEPPANTEPTNADVGSDRTIDSNIDQYGRSMLVVLAAGDNVEHVDAGWAPQSPTAITLDSFRVMAEGTGARIVWRTLTEVGSLSFRVLRSRSGQLQDAVAVNETPVPAVGGNGGARYEVFDAVGGRGVTYWLEETEVDGDVLLYGPFTMHIAVPTTNQTYIPWVAR
jgi:uncharacterized repeat protein (TIGR01451 family)/fimbrial isopeptide formation D2 family protein